MRWLALFAMTLPTVAGCKRAAAPAPDLARAPDLMMALPGGDDEVRSVYPVTDAPPDPLAKRYCAALHALPEERRAACCGGQPAASLADECTRVLSAAMKSGAVRIAGAEVDACAAAMARAHEGCDWPGIFPPSLPSECALRGTLAAGARCRSSLECAGALRCHGAGPTTAGTCGKALGAGAPCGISADALAAVTRDDGDRTHPECEGSCQLHRCMAPVALGKPCQLSAHCGAGRRCANDRCVEGALGSAGAGCTGGDCAPGLRCHQGKCFAPRRTGEPCASEFECRGGCLVPEGGTRGTCGPRCDRR